MMMTKLMLLLLLMMCMTMVTALSPSEEAPCTRAMFGNSSKAWWACSAQHALQRNWFPDPIQGLFSYQSWNGMDGFWQNGVLIESMANAMYYLNNTRYESAVVNSYRPISQLLLAYGPQPSFDDMAWYGLAYARVFEVTGKKHFLSLAGEIFNWVWKQGWDTATCGGGIWFDQTRGGKQTIENVQMVQLGAKLARLMKKGGQFKKRAEILWKWLELKVIDHKTFQVYDGIDLSSCERSDNTTYTYTAGTAIGAMVELSKINKNESYLWLAHNMSHSVMSRLTLGGVLMEPCDREASCDLDAQIFKGIFVRNLRYLMDISHPSKIKPYENFIEKNIMSIKQHSMCSPGNKTFGESYEGKEKPSGDTYASENKISGDSYASENKITDDSNASVDKISGNSYASEDNDNTCHIVYLHGPPSYPATGPVFDSVWTGPYNESRPIQQTSALDLLLAGVERNIRCNGAACHYDPRPPPPHSLTCKDDPCPVGQECCEYSGQYTCCNPGQVCQQGFCN